MNYTVKLPNDIARCHNATCSFRVNCMRYRCRSTGTVGAMLIPRLDGCDGFIKVPLGGGACLTQPVRPECENCGTPATYSGYHNEAGTMHVCADCMRAHRLDYSQIRRIWPMPNNPEPGSPLNQKGQSND